MFKFFKQIKNKILIYILLSSIAGNVYAQQFSKDYTPIKSSGLLPDEFLKTARSMSTEDIKTIGYGQDRAAKQQFIMANNYFLKDLLLSGNILINDPFTNYVNKIADELLKNNPILRQQLHIYVTKSSDVNAYAFDKGFIFINIGLLAQLENEAQLAFVLAHEIEHVVKKHSVMEYIENVKLENGTSSYERGSYDERSLAKYRFSKEQESDADLEGLNRIKNTNYSIKALNGAFDVLQYSYLPFELLDFKKSFFEDSYLILPDTLFLKKISDIKSNDDYDDSKSTHPNIRKRRGAIEPEFKVTDESNRKKYIVSEVDFKNLRETARFELCRLYMIERDYINAIYAAYILLEKYPDNLFLKKIVSQGLYNVLVNKSSSNNQSVSIIGNSSMDSEGYSIPDYTNIEGASQRVYFMMANLESKELNTIALSYTYKAHKQYPDDKILSALTDSLFSVLINSNSLFLNDFSKKSKAELKNLETMKVVAIDTTDVEESKYSKIKKQQQKAEVDTEDNFTKYAFVDLLKDEEFVSRFSKMAKGHTQKPAPTDEYLKNTKTLPKKKNTDAPYFGIDKVIFVDPFYMKVINDHGTKTVNYYESEDRQQVLLNIQKKCADRLKLQYECLTTKDITASDIETYNDNALINEWLGERFKHGNNNEELVTSSENIKQLIEKLGSKHVAWSGIYNIKGKTSRNTYFFILLDLETGKLKKFETRYTRTKDNDDIITSFVYNSLMHVVMKPKE